MSLSLDSYIAAGYHGLGAELSTDDPEAAFPELQGALAQCVGGRPFPDLCGLLFRPVQRLIMVLRLF